MLKLARLIRTRWFNFTTSGSVPGQTRLLNVNRLKSVMMFGFGVEVPGFRMNDKKTLHAHRHLHHFVGMRMVHLHAVLFEGELVSVSFAGRNMFLR